MGTTVTSWYIDQLEKRASEPVRKFYLGGSDHSAKVRSWPTISRSINTLRSSTVNVRVSNMDGTYNGFYDDVYTIVKSAYLEYGFSHPTSGDEMVKLFSGNLKKVKYGRQQVTFQFRDRLHSLTQARVGESAVPVEIDDTLVSEIAWTLCTCYGPYSDVRSTSNPDIDYTKFSEWAATFSQDQMVMSTRYEGLAVSKAVVNLAEQSDSMVWTDGEGKLVFQRFTESSSLDFLIEDRKDRTSDLSIDGLSVINKQYTEFNWDVTSRYWTHAVVHVSSSSVNTYGIHARTSRDKTVWHVTSIDALVHAQRSTFRNDTPPRKFTISTPMFATHRGLGDTCRMVNSFYGVTSADGWRVIEHAVNLNNLTTKWGVDEAYVATGFYLDTSSLDGDDRIL